MDNDLFLLGVLVQRLGQVLKEVLLYNKNKFQYLAYMYICRRTNHVDFKISFTSIAKPPKEPCILTKNHQRDHQ